MCGGGPSPPPVANPNDVATNQQQLDLQSAISQQAMNQVNQFTPYGSLQYTQTGVGAGGVPIMDVNQQYSPQQQALLNTLTQGQFAGGQAGMNMLNNAFPLYAGGLPNIGSAAGGATQAEMGLITNALQPNFEMTREQLDTQLRNQGISPGTPAYQQQMNNLLQSQGQVYSGALAQIEPAAYSQALQNYQLPFQMGQQLLSMAQPTAPTYAQTPQGTVTPANLVGATANAQQAQEAAYQAQVAQQAAAVNGISNIIGLGLGGFLGGKFSDRRMKKNVSKIGIIKELGIPLYKWKYLFDNKWHVGPMAQDVEMIAPELVSEINGMRFIHLG